MKVDIQILGRTYGMECDEAEASGLKAAASHVDAKLQELRKAMPRLENDRLAVLVALNLCQELLTANKALQEVSASQRLVMQMIDEAEALVEAGD